MCDINVDISLTRLLQRLLYASKRGGLSALTLETDRPGQATPGAPNASAHWKS